MSPSLKSLFLSLYVIVPLVCAAAIGQRSQSLVKNGLEERASSFWLENISHQGIAAFNSNSGSYKVFRNVKDYGAKGDGTTDDTTAINAAIQDGSRCGEGCDSSTIVPALVYFPAGTYVVSAPIVAMYYSQLVGDPTNIPTLKATAGFQGTAVIDADPYNSSGTNWYTSTNNFYRAVRNFVIDITAAPAAGATGIHWQVAQATSLINISFKMSTASGNGHQGIFMEDGSGGFMSDLTFSGGKYGMWIGNQQFMSRNLKFSNCNTAIYLNWNWAWTFKSLDIESCQVGIDIAQDNGSGGQNVGSVVILDSQISNTPIGVRSTHTTSSSPATGGSLVLDNVQLTNVPQAVANTQSGTVLAGGTTTIDTWGQGHTYSGSSTVSNVQSTLTRPFSKPAVLLDSTGKVFEKTRPQYETVAASNFISVRSNGAKGDGTTDDTAAIQAIFTKFGGNTNNIIFFDHGVYPVSSTIKIPVNTIITGEVWAVIMATGTNWSDMSNPSAVFQVGNAGDTGTVEMSDMIFQTHGPQPGAILLEWNSADPSGKQGANGMWDVHFRVGGSAGTNLEPAQCIKNPSQKSANTACEGAFMQLHIGKTATLYMDNVWAWTADHGQDAPHDQVSIYNGRGILDESTNGPVWMYAVAAEHSQLYQFQFANTQNVFMAMPQTETPYYQPSPNAASPFTSLTAWNDPSFTGCTSTSCEAWALRVLNSKSIMAYSTGFYSFFQDYTQDCIDPQTCQDTIVDIEKSQVVLYNHNTVAVTNMVTVDGTSMAPASANVNTFARTAMEISTSS